MHKFIRKLIVHLVLGLSFLPSAVPAQPSRPPAFNPVRGLTTWYTDRTPIDIEVIGGFDSKRVLRFRLERAFVQHLIAREVTIVSFGLDMDTGLPASLFNAVSDKGRLERIAGVPPVPFPELLTRTLNIKITGDSSALFVQRTSDRLRTCAGEPADKDLLVYNVDNSGRCRRSSYPGGSRHIAKYDDKLLLPIQCHKPEFRGTGRTIRFPFEGFSVEEAFHRNHLSHWREIVNRAAAFLKSKQYRTG
jgi:hypothetical protein